MPALAEALKATDENVRRTAFETLARMGPEAKEAVPVLAKILKEENMNDDKRIQEEREKGDFLAIPSRFGSPGPSSEAYVFAFRALEKIDPEAAKKAIANLR